MRRDRGFIVYIVNIVNEIIRGMWEGFVKDLASLRSGRSDLDS
jgi:hypothetical protein